jgi:uncharacterized membrane protein YhaH (DUF805 family)
MESNLSPIGWAVRPLKRYAEFSGRSSRAEIWWFFLALFVMYIVMWFAFAGTIVSGLAAAGQSGAGPSAGLLGGLGIGVMIFGLIWLLLIIPTISVQMRRLHDTDRSGWWLGGFYLLYFVYIGMIARDFTSMMSATMADPSQPPAVAATSGVTTILGLVIFIYSIALLVFYCLPGTRGQNRFGPDPYSQDVEQVFA